MNCDYETIFILYIFIVYLQFSKCSADNTYQRHRHTEQQQIGNDNATANVNNDDRNADKFHTDENDSNELKNNANVPMNFCRCDANECNNHNHNHTNTNNEIDDKTMYLVLAPSPNVSNTNRNMESICGSVPSTSDGNDNPTLKQSRRRLRTPVWARSFTLQFYRKQEKTKI